MGAGGEDLLESEVVREAVQKIMRIPGSVQCGIVALVEDSASPYFSRFD